MKIISTIGEVKNYISLAGTFKFDKLSPHIDRVLRTYILKLLGRELLDEISDAYDAALRNLESKVPNEKASLSDTGKQYSLMEEKYWELMQYLQDAVCNISYMNCIAQMQTTMSNEGIRLAVNDNQKTAFQWQIDDLKFQLATDGYGALNNLLVYLENNIDSFPSWESSESYAEQKKYFVESADLFNNAYYISNNRMTYLTLRYIMQRVELFEVKRIIGVEVFVKLKEAQKNGYTVKERILMENFLIPGIVLLTVAKGIVERAIEVSDIGVQANLYTYYVSLKDSRKKSQYDVERNAMVDQLNADGNEFLQEARKYIDANADEFGVVNDASSIVNFRINNKAERGIFGM